MTPGLSAPTPHIVYQTQGNQEFFRQPFPRLKAAVWLFRTPEDREQFLGVYVGEPLEIGDDW